MQTNMEVPVSFSDFLRMVDDDTKFRGQLASVELAQAHLNNNDSLM